MCSWQRYKKIRRGTRPDAMFFVFIERLTFFIYSQNFHEKFIRSSYKDIRERIKTKILQSSSVTFMNSKLSDLTTK